MSNLGHTCVRTALLAAVGLAGFAVAVAMPLAVFPVTTAPAAAPIAKSVASEQITGQWTADVERDGLVSFGIERRKNGEFHMNSRSGYPLSSFRGLSPTEVPPSGGQVQFQ